MPAQFVNRTKLRQTVGNECECHCWSIPHVHAPAASRPGQVAYALGKGIVGLLQQRTQDLHDL